MQMKTIAEIDHNNIENLRWHIKKLAVNKDFKK